MSKFEVKYPDGSFEIEVVHDCADIEAYCNRKFGFPKPQNDKVVVKLLADSADHLGLSEKPKKAKKDA